VKLHVDLLHTGVSGNVLINSDADRVNSYNVWNYAEGHDSYYRSMLVDLTQPPGQVSHFLYDDDDDDDDDDEV